MKMPVDVRLEIWNRTREIEIASSIEVADRPATRNKGLLGRDGLAPGAGLWIVSCAAVHTFGMRFPIDLVYLDRKKRVKKVRSDVRPWRMSGCLFAHSVLELACGTVRKTQTAPGDQLEFAAAATEDNAKQQMQARALNIVSDRTPLCKRVFSSLAVMYTGVHTAKIL
jgi:hypothetical protein